MALIVYADFSCPDCYLAAHRVDALDAAGRSVDWRMVEHRPGLPVTGTRLSVAEQDAVAARFAALDGELQPHEALPRVRPVVRPRTEAAVSAYAEVYGTPVAAEVRRLLFGLFWRQGLDIGSPTVLRTPLAGPVLRAGSAAYPLHDAGYAVSVTGAPVTTAACRRVAAWRQEWTALGRPALPVVLADDGALTGVAALRRLAAEEAAARAEVEPALPDPRRYPAVAGHPDRNWVSWIGGRWRYLYRTAA